MNLLGQNIGQNYRGILNLGATINSPLSTTLQSVTDGMGNNSPLQLSTTEARVLGDLSVHKNSGLLAYFGASAGNSGISLYFNQISFVGGNAMYLSNTGSNIIFETNSVERGRFASSNFVLGTTTASARLHVRGDGINPIARFENNSAASSLLINAAGDYHQYGSNGNVGMFITNQAGNQSISGGALNWYAALASTAGFSFRYVNGSNFSYTSGNGGLIDIGSLGGVFAAGAGSGNFRPLAIAYTINNSGAQTGTATGIFLNATETALNGMAHNLIDLQVGGVSRFRVKNDGISETTGYYFGVARLLFNNGSYATNRGLMSASGNGIFTLLNAAENDFGRLQLGGTTNAFPAIKRNGAAIDFRLADDSAACAITASTFSSPSRFLINSDASTGADGNIVLSNTGGTTFGLLKLGGTTNSFPAIKRNGAAIDIRTADDGGPANLNAREIAASVGFFAPNSTEVRGTYIRARATTFLNFSDGTQGVLIDSASGTTANASAILQADSTTKGFLPPRGNNGQMLAIASPAAGLIFYDTTNNTLNYYNGTTWISL